MPTIQALYCYPVKSCRGIALDAAPLTDTGIAHDREWMVVDCDGRFISQRESPALALIVPALESGALVLQARGAAPVSIPFDHAGESREVTIWDDQCVGIDQGDDAARWLAARLGRAVRLVRFDQRVRRRSDPGWTGETVAYTAFSDGYALLVISQASLDDLNSRLPSPLPMNRFRPNIVLGGLGPFGEDRLTDLVADGVRLRVVKPCTRCIITTTDQDSGVASGTEPLRTLKTYRWNARLRGVTFGQNVVIVEGAGRELRIGQFVSG
jgi:uncharacterized protein YcbX